MKNEFNVDQIKKLWVLDLIIQTGSLKAAATQAKVTASAISQSLSTLEKNVGKPLIIRDKGQLLPTQDALSILKIVRPAFEVFSKLNDLGSQPVPQISWLNFGTYESLAIDVLPGLIHRLRERMPHLRLGLRISRTQHLLTLLRKGELCSAIVTEVDDLDRFYAVRVSEDRLGVFVSARHPISQMGWKAVESYGLGSLSAPKDGLPRYFNKFMRKIGNIKPTVLSESFETLRAATASGVITSVLPLHVATRSNDLIEITPSTASKDTGAHGIFVVSPSNCDRQETDFLADEAKKLLNKN